MSTFTYITDVHEVELDNDFDVVRDYEENLPHHTQIIETVTKKWNDANMVQYYDGILENKIASAIMSGRKSKTGETELLISFVMKPKVRLTEKIRNAIVDQTSAQMSDGWGEGVFGPIFIMKDENNNHFYIE